MDYYKTLGVEKSASSNEIKKAFRDKAMKYHPDKNLGDKKAEDMFKEVNSAYEVLSNPEKKQMYDNGVDPNQNKQGPGGFGRGRDPFADMFSRFNMGFGFGGSSHNQEERQQAVNVNISVSLYDSIFGVDKNIEFNYKPVCESCGGSGAKESETCKHCGGRGMVAEQRGNSQMITTCPICRGTGKMMIGVCDKCGGTGYVETKTRKLIIKIKPGTRSGERLVINGAGIPNKAGVFGPLLVNIDVVFPDKSSFSNEDKDILQRILDK